jgi:hypothetical protein
MQLLFLLVKYLSWWMTKTLPRMQFPHDWHLPGAIPVCHYYFSKNIRICPFQGPVTWKDVRLSVCYSAFVETNVRGSSLALAVDRSPPMPLLSSNSRRYLS